MSIKPAFAERILSGEKRVEFRKQAFREDVSHVLIYSTTPIAAIVGVCEVDAVFIGSPASVWRKYAAVGGINRDDFAAYYGDRQQAVAISIANVVEFGASLPLSAVGERRPPQSFRYLRSVRLRDLFAAAAAQ